MAQDGQNVKFDNGGGDASMDSSVPSTEATDSEPLDEPAAVVEFEVAEEPEAPSDEMAMDAEDLEAPTATEEKAPSRIAVQPWIALRSRRTDRALRS